MDFHPPEELHGEIVTLRRYRLTDRDALKAAIAASLESLRDWMPWGSATADGRIGGQLSRPGRRAVRRRRGCQLRDHAARGRSARRRLRTDAAHRSERAGDRVLGALRVSSAWHRHRVRTAAHQCGACSIWGSSRRDPLRAGQRRERRGRASFGIPPGSGQRWPGSTLAGKTGRMMIWIIEQPV